MKIMNTPFIQKIENERLGSPKNDVNMERTDKRGKFSQLIKDAARQVNQKIIVAGELSEQMAAAKPVDLAQTMIALTEADISFRLLVEVRNKALGAYQEVMRMQL